MASIGKDAEVKTTKSAACLHGAVSWRRRVSCKGKKTGDGYVRGARNGTSCRLGKALDVCGDSEERRASLVEGELRNREFVDKKHKKVKVRLAEIHLGKIGKLDRAEKRDPNAAPPDLPTNGDEAPF